MREFGKTKRVLAAGVGSLFMAGAAQAVTVYGLTTDNNVFTFDSGSPNNILSGHFVSGLQSNEILVGIDFRPATGQLYGIGSTSRVYTIDGNTGIASPVGAGVPFAPILNGTSFDIDFNPTVDRIRLVSDADQNLRINPITGLTASNDLAINYAGGNPNLAGAAYTNNFAGAGSTTLYTIDSGFDILNIQTPPNDGTQVMQTTLKDSGSNPIDVSGLLGFDISQAGIAYVSVQQGGNGYSQFSSINLTTGVLANVSSGSPTSGLIGPGLFVRDITVLAVPEPTALSVLALGAFAGLRRRSNVR